jgi:hypothetical protein
MSRKTCLTHYRTTKKQNVSSTQTVQNEGIQGKLRPSDRPRAFPKIFGLNFVRMDHHYGEFHFLASTGPV